MSPRRLDVPALIGGLVALVLGLVLLLDRAGVWELHFNGLVPLFLGATGAVLLATGLDNRDREADADP